MAGGIFCLTNAFLYVIFGAVFKTNFDYVNRKFFGKGSSCLLNDSDVLLLLPADRTGAVI